jgi:Transposase C of IS166 homeodomain
MHSAETITISKAEYERIRAENEWLRRQIFGRKSEHFVPKQESYANQLTLFYEGQVLEASAEETVGQFSLIAIRASSLKCGLVIKA